MKAVSNWPIQGGVYYELRCSNVHAKDLGLVFSARRTRPALRCVSDIFALEVILLNYLSRERPARSAPKQSKLTRLSRSQTKMTIIRIKGFIFLIIIRLITTSLRCYHRKTGVPIALKKAPLGSAAVLIAAMFQLPLKLPKAIGIRETRAS